MASSSNKISHRKVKRILVTNYETDLSKALVEQLITRKCCILIVFTDSADVANIQHVYGKKLKGSNEGLIVPILIDFTNKDETEKIIKNLPLIDFAINIFEKAEHKSRSIISKQLAKAKVYRTIELNLQKTTEADLIEKVFKSNEFCIINCVNDSPTGLSAVQEFLETTGNDLKPITSQLSTGIRNSMRKLFSNNKQKSCPVEEGESPAESQHKRSSTLPLSFGKKKSAKEADAETIPTTEPKSRISRFRRTVSLIRRKKKTENANESQSNNPKSSILEEIHNRIWEKENKKLSKGLHKLHSNLNKSYESRKKKLNTTKVNHQKKVAKEVETKMQREKNFLMNKNADINSATLSRSTALTPDTANRIVASREARIDREVGRSANKRKVDEFQKLDVYYQEQVEKLKTNQIKETIKSQLSYLERNTKKFKNKLIEAEEKYWDLVNN